MNPTLTKTFEIRICQSEPHQVKFCLISPETLAYVEPDIVEKKIRVFTNYYIAFRPGVPVILFEIEPTALTGACVFKDVDGERVYHLPPHLYDSLEDILKETEFIISYDLFKELIETDNVYGTILKCLQPIQYEKGLNVLGISYESKETQI